MGQSIYTHSIFYPTNDIWNGSDDLPHINQAEIEGWTEERPDDSGEGIGWWEWGVRGECARENERREERGKGKGKEKSA